MAGYIYSMDLDRQFDEVYVFIISARERANRAVNTELIDLYWRIGEYIAHRVEVEEWEKGVAKNLVSYLKHQEPN